MTAGGPDHYWNCNLRWCNSRTRTGICSTREQSADRQDIDARVHQRLVSKVYLLCHCLQSICPPDASGIEEQLTKQASEDRVDAAIDAGFAKDDPTLVEALPAMGKSRGVISWAAETGNPLTIFTSRHELYDQYEEWSRDEDLTYRVLPGFHSTCPTMVEGLRLKSQAEEVYEAGITGQEIHENASGYFGQQLPCQDGGPCPYIRQRKFDREQYDVLVGHYLQAHNESNLKGRFVAFDEFPGDAYFFEPTHNEATRAITNYLQADDTLPFRNWKELRRNGHREDVIDAVEEWKSNLSDHYHRDSRVKLQQSPDFHANAPLLTLAGLEFELLENDWEYRDLGGGRIAVRSPEDEWSLLIPPWLWSAESIIALDGTPTISKWRLALGGRWMAHEEALASTQEKREYLRDVLGLRIIQTDGGAKPYQSGAHVNVDSDGALLEGICEQEGSKPSIITSKQARNQYRDASVDEFIESAEHFGNLKGSNQFATTRLGAVIGSPHPPEDEAVERWAALDHRAVERKTDEEGNPLRGPALDFGPAGNALFRDVVQKEVLQAVMRFGRTSDDGEKGATVYVHTSRLPHWVEPDDRVTVGTWSSGMEEVVAALRQSEAWPEEELTNGEIVERVSVSTKQVCELMKELDEEGYVTHRRGGVGNAYHWADVCLEEFSQYGRLEFAE